MKQIGSVSVDAGCIWVGDPCYVIGGDSSFSPALWADYCKILDEIDHWDSGESYCEPLGDGIGMHVQTMYGDGSYPVYAEFDGNKVKRLIIDLE